MSDYIDEVFAFFPLMVKKLEKNKGKPHWNHLNKEDLLELLKIEIIELEREIESNGDPLDIQLECADVANFAMMIADVAVQEIKGDF